MLEAVDGFALLVGNALHMQKVPGRTTDVQDADWICDLHRHGLIRGSCIPGRAQRELREFVRYRQSLVEMRTSEANRLAKVLEGGNIKLHSAVTDVLGESSRDMLRATADGISDPEVLANLVRGPLKKKREALVVALRGTVQAHQRQLLGLILDHVRHLDGEIGMATEQIGVRLAAYRELQERLDEIPGVSALTAQTILAEAGCDMKPFETSGQLAAWAGMAPGSNESGGKRRPARTRKGSKTLTRVLVQAGKSLSRNRKTYLGAAYGRIAARRGGNRAAVAIGRRILTIAYHVIKDGSRYQELGANYLDERRRDRVTRALVRRLERLGYAVDLAPASGRVCLSGSK